MLFKKLMGLHSRFTSWASRQFFHSLLPASCVFCGQRTEQSHNVCLDCKHSLPRTPAACQQCGLTLAEINDTEQAVFLCGSCLYQAPPFDKTYALFPYEPPIVQLIIQLKFQHKLSHAKALSDLFLSAIQEKWYVNTPLPDRIIPIPLHTKRLCERGFNQALEIAKPIAAALNLPLVRHRVKRIRPTLAQSSLTAAGRQENMKNAFVVLEDYTGLSIAVLDDVITTGHTVTELCKTLKQHGAKHIALWCAARCEVALKAKNR